MSDYLKGIIIITLGVIILSPDSLLLRLLHGDTWAIVFWRGINLAVGVLILMLLIYRGRTWQQIKKIGKKGIVIGFIFGISNVFFALAIQHTSIANTLVIISVSPMFSALLSWGVLKEKVPLRTWVAMLVIVIAITSIMSNSTQGNNVVGDLCALATSVCMAISFTLMRHYKEVNMVPAMIISGLSAAFISIIVVVLTGVSFQLTSGSIPVLILGGVLVSIAFYLIALGPRYLSAPEIGLIMPLESVFCSYFAWLFINEAPTDSTVIGGIVVLLALTTHSWIALRENRCEH